MPHVVSSFLHILTLCSIAPGSPPSICIRFCSCSVVLVQAVLRRGHRKCNASPSLPLHNIPLSRSAQKTIVADFAFKLSVCECFGHARIDEKRPVNEPTASGCSGATSGQREGSTTYRPKADPKSGLSSSSMRGLNDARYVHALPCLYYTEACICRLIRIPEMCHTRMESVKRARRGEKASLEGTATANGNSDPDSTLGAGENLKAR